MGERSLHLYADWSRQLIATDPEGRDLILSCGAALHHLRMTLPSFGWSGIVHRVPDPYEPDHLASVEFVPHTTTSHDIELARAIAGRRTDRRRMSSWPVPIPLIWELIDVAHKENTEVIVAKEPRVRWALIEAAIRAASRQQANSSYDNELVLWTARHSGSNDAVPAANLLSQPDSATTELRKFPQGELTQSTTAIDEEDCSQLLVLSTRTDEQKAWLQAGEALSAVLLTATAQRLATCPLSQPLEIPESRQLVRTAVTGTHVYPHIIIRVGWAPISAKPLAPTPRRPVSEILSHISHQVG